MVDGDTLRLENGQLVRLTGINTPELGRDGAPDQPLAAAARQSLKQLISKGNIQLEPAVKRRDRYRRKLGAVFVDGRHAAAVLLEQGLGWHIIVPPDTGYIACLQRAERRARERGAGVWASEKLAPVAAAKVRHGDSGFIRLRGRVTSVSRSRHSWWLELDQAVSVKLDHRDLKYFDGLSPKKWQGRTLQLRGWLIYRGRSQRGYPPWMMQLRHPAMLEASTL